MEEQQLPARVTVLIVSRNQNEPLRRTLASLAPGSDASSPAVEVIVVDNASTDGSATVDSDFLFVKMLRMQRNFGWTKAVNVGTRTAAGEYLCLTPPGTEFSAGAIGALVDALESDLSALAVAPLAVDAQGTTLTRAYPLPDAEMLQRFWRTGQMGKPQPFDTTAQRVPAQYVVGSPLLLRRHMIAANYLDERYGQFWSDAELAFQIARAGRSVVVLPQIKVIGVPPYQMIPENLDRAGALLSADAALGAAAYLGKHSGFAAGARFRIGAVLAALGSALSFQQAGPKFSRLMALVSGQKIDGTQGQS